MLANDLIPAWARSSYKNLPNGTELVLSLCNFEFFERIEEVSKAEFEKIFNIFSPSNLTSAALLDLVAVLLKTVTVGRESEVELPQGRSSPKNSFWSK